MKFIKFMLTIVVIAATSLTALPAQAATPPRVVVLGDSIVGQMCGGEHQSIPTRQFPSVDVGCYGWPGVTSGGMFRQVMEPGWVDPANVYGPTQKFNLRNAINNSDVLVIGLGTNNAMRQQPAQWLGWDIDNFMGLANGRQVIWYDLGIRQWPGAMTDNNQFRSANAQNVMLWSKMAQYPNLRVLPWGGEAGRNSNYLLPDGVHLTPAGIDRRWNMLM